jgi:FAD binding domain/Berberine and berberine like
VTDKSDPTEPVSAAGLAELANQIDGSLFTPDHVDYPAESRGFDLAFVQRPDVVIAATSSADVARAVRFAYEHHLPVGLMATGHGQPVPMTEGLLINTARLTEVQVDPLAATARVAAGATWEQVVAATAPYGLAPLSGSAPGVGAIGYTLGGGIGLLSRRYGFAADHVNRIDLITADGRELVVTPDQYPDLFWALRGGGGNFGAVTAIEIGLFPVAELYGGALFFAGEQSAQVLAAFRAGVDTAPDSLSLSIAFVTFPNAPVIPAPLRGRFCVSVRVAYFGDEADGRRLIDGLRGCADSILDTVRTMPSTEIGTIHSDPTRPMPVNSASVALRSIPDELDQHVLAVIGPSCPFLVEVRHLGGALARPPAIANAVGHCNAALNVFTSALPGSDQAVARMRQDEFIASLQPWSDGGALLNFQPTGKTSRADIATLYEPEILERLMTVKASWDPANSFRFNQNLQP